MYLVDTDVMIDIQRGYGPAVSWFASLPELPSIPGFVVMELIQDAQNKQQMRKVLQLLAPLTIVWPTETDCARALSDFSALKKDCFDLICQESLRSFENHNATA